PATEQLVETLAVRRQLSAEKAAAENASRLLEETILRRLSRRRIRRLAADIEVLDERLLEDSCNRCCARPPLPTAHLDAGSRIAVGLHADRALARARPHESQTSRCSGWCCALRLRERHAQG